MTDTAKRCNFPKEARVLIEQLCKDLNGAHDEILRMQGCKNPEAYDWPEWTPQANSIRIAEKMLGQKLAKTNIWTIFPVSREHHDGYCCEGGDFGSVHDCQKSNPADATLAGKGAEKMSRTTKLEWAQSIARKRFSPDDEAFAKCTGAILEAWVEMGVGEPEAQKRAVETGWIPPVPQLALREEVERLRSLWNENALAQLIEQAQEDFAMLEFGAEGPPLPWHKWIAKRLVEAALREGQKGSHDGHS